MMGRKILHFGSMGWLYILVAGSPVPTGWAKLA